MINLSEKFKSHRILLGSASPRRKQLLTDLEIPFEVLQFSVEESYPANLKRESVALYLASLKAAAGKNFIQDNDLLITADTIVWLDPEVLNKPADAAEAKRMLYRLSGKTHEVITGVSISDVKKSSSFYAVTEVTFKSLLEEEIDWYISKYKPFDKAGSYGIQEWIGQIGIEKINGSYTNVVGLPLSDLYAELKRF
ncbi:MAG: septum formation protein Maf [Bacteroidetes bacterium]|nr:septum formation protein Maf [Bacteroidota bacterium]